MQGKDCDFYREQLFDYVSDLLGEEEQAELLAHIEFCPGCKTELAKIQEIISATSMISDVEVPEELRVAVSEKLSNLGRSNAITLKRRRINRFASVALPIAACTVLAIGIFSGGIYDKFMSSEDIISSGLTERVTTSEVDIKEPAGDKTEALPEQSDDNILSEVKSNQGNVARNDSVKKNRTEPASKADTARMREEFSEEPQTAEALSEGYANSAETQSTTPTGEEINESHARMIYSADTEQEIDGLQEDTPQVASSGAVNAAEEAVAEKAPSSCTVVTDDASSFADKFGVGNNSDEISFEITADEWTDFETFAVGQGAELNVSYSDENNGYVIITIRER